MKHSWETNTIDLRYITGNRQFILTVASGLVTGNSFTSPVPRQQPHLSIEPSLWRG
jgi:hypothetical protein